MKYTQGSESYSPMKLLGQPSLDSSVQVEKFLDGIEEIDELPRQSALKEEISYQ